MNKYIGIICVLFSTLLCAQEESKWRMGGGFGLNFGDRGYLAISVEPTVGYQISRMLEGGVSVGYQYAKWDISRQNLIHFGPYLNFYPVESLFMKVHFEQYYGNQKNKYSFGESSTIDFEESALWLGVGYHTSGKVRFHTGLMYNVLYKENESLFANSFKPIVGVSVGL